MNNEWQPGNYRKSYRWRGREEMILDYTGAGERALMSPKERYRPFGNVFVW